MEHQPGLKEDAKNLSVVTGSAIVAGLITVGLLASQATSPPRQPVQPVVIDVEPAAQPVEIEGLVVPPSGIYRLYGTVTDTDGAEFTGFIRWDRNEGSSTDLLDATKPRHRGGSSISGIRFGHVDRIDVTGRKSALLTLKNGEQVELTANASDLGSGLRALLVTEADGAVAEFGWRDLESVDFTSPGSALPTESRLFGTLQTRTGVLFTGYITWDIDEIYSTDVLDGDADGARMRIPFGRIAAIQREGSWGSRVTLRDGKQLILEGTNDVDSSISGIEVSDPTLGSIKLDWNEFDRVTFHASDENIPVIDLDGGTRIAGTVVTVDGERYSGDIVWDDDEMFTWEMLNGDIGNIEFHVEFGHIAGIQKSQRGAIVTLKDGRLFELSNSNDVDRGNRGITIQTDGREYEVEWRDFAEVKFER